MKKCTCSERPLGIIDSSVQMIDSAPYQVLSFGCTNKNCSRYKQVSAVQRINLLDTKQAVQEEEII